MARGGERQSARVESVDVSHPPPSYGIRLLPGGSFRETEAGRLISMAPSEVAAAAASAAKLLSVPAGACLATGAGCCNSKHTAFCK